VAGPVIDSAPLMTTPLIVWVSWAPAASVAVTTTLNVPVAVGVPLIVPALLIVTPVGRPVADHVNGVVPPLALPPVVGYGRLIVQDGSEVGAVIVGAVLIVIVYGWLFDEPAASVMVTVTVFVPVADGVPERTPAELIDMPVGRLLADHVEAPVPPVPVNVTGVYGRFTVQFGTELGERIDGWALICNEIEDVLAVAPAASVTVMVTVAEPLADGVPEITPPLVIDMPAGRPLADHVYGAVPPVAVAVTDG
jgi:hypothetical protein